MHLATDHTDGNSVTSNLETIESAVLLGVNQVAQLLGNCSKRHIYRLADAGHMPRPIRLGSLIRWRRIELLSWIDAGCPRNLSTKQVAL